LCDATLLVASYVYLRIEELNRTVNFNFNSVRSLQYKMFCDWHLLENIISAFVSVNCCSLYNVKPGVTGGSRTEW